MRSLLAVTAVLEAVAGLALVVSPALFVGLLLGTSFDTPAGLAVGRITGAALVALAVACWVARDNPPGRAAQGLIAAMLFYNIAVVAILTHARIFSNIFGIAFWPAVVLHGVMAVWCVAGLRVRRIAPAMRVEQR